MFKVNKFYICHSSILKCCIYSCVLLLCMYLWTSVCVLLGHWDDIKVCPGGLKGMQVACSTICLATILRQFFTTCLVELQTHTWRYPPTRICTILHTRTYTHQQKPTGGKWNILLISLRPRPGGPDHRSGHMALGCARMPTHDGLAQICAHTHTLLFHWLCSFSLCIQILALAYVSKCAYLNIAALKKNKTFLSHSL